MLPPIVDISTGRSSSSSSMAVVPFQSVDVPLALAQLHDYKADTEPIDINRIRNVSMEHLRALEERGVVSTTEAEDGGCQIAVIPSAIEVSSLVRLQLPCQAFRSLSSVAPTTLPKLYYCVRLALNDWLPADDGAILPFNSDAQKHYNCDFKRPLSYFMALASHEAIMAKAVPAIMHDQGDAYYRCLSHLPEDRWTAALADIAG